MTQLKGKVEIPTHPAKGFDTDTRLTAKDAAIFYADHYRFCLRYLSRGPESRHDLSHREAQDILDAGLALMPIQHVNYEHHGKPWRPDADLGTLYGKMAASNALAVGFPKGVNVWCDLENTRGVAADVVAFCRNWYEHVDQRGYVPGLYVGAACGLNAQRLDSLPFKHYWRSFSADAPRVARRSYQIVQHSGRGHLHANVPIDVDRTRADHFGDHVCWLAPNTGRSEP